MRYAPAERLLRLATALAGTRVGLTLDEMQAETGVERRTILRMRNTLLDLYPALEAHIDGDGAKRWRMPGAALAGITAPRPEAISAVEASAREQDARGDTDRAALLREAATTMRALMHPTALRRAEPDIAALMEAEGIAMRPGPRQKLLPGLMPALRRAILGMQAILVRYANPNATEPATRILCPYGILYGGRGWLVAHVDGLPELRLWRLDRIRKIDLVDRIFTRREDFDLRAYAARSFGVWQEEPVDVALRFTPEAAADAEAWLFQPGQTVQREPDGSVTIRFRAGGAQEMCWHLFTWGTAVTILAPESLRQALAETATTVGEHHG